MEPILLLTTLDQNYLPQLQVLLTSLSLNNPGEIFSLHLLHSSILTSSLAVSIMNVKYVNGLPLYRSIQEFLRNDTTSPNR